MTEPIPKYKTKQIHVQTAAWDLLKIDRIPDVLSRNDEPGYEVCGIVPSGKSLFAIYRRIEN